MGTYVGLLYGNGEHILDGKGNRVREMSMDKWADGDKFALLPARLKPNGTWEFPLMRPLDFKVWREAVAQFEHGSELFTAWLDVLEADPDIWIDVSW